MCARSAVERPGKRAGAPAAQHTHRPSRAALPGARVRVDSVPNPRPVPARPMNNVPRKDETQKKRSNVVSALETATATMREPAPSDPGRLSPLHDGSPLRHSPHRAQAVALKQALTAICSGGRLGDGTAYKAAHTARPSDRSQQQHARHVIVIIARPELGTENSLT